MRFIQCGFARRGVLLVVLAAAQPAPAQTNPPAVTPSQPLALFDGKGLAGWGFVTKGTNADAAAIWAVRDGVLRCAGRPNGYARTRTAYQDYQLHVEWRWPAGPGNSGVFLHVSGPDKVWPRCLEVQLASGNAGEIRLNGGAQLRAAAAVQEKSVPRRAASSERPPGAWNACDIVCRGDTVTVRINGVLQNEVAGTSVAAGAIGLQAEGKPVEFRHIELRPLPAAPAGSR